MGGDHAHDKPAGPTENRTRKLEGVDYKRAALEYPSRIDPQNRYYLLTKPFYDLRERSSKHRGFGLDAETHRYFCDFANIAVALDLEPGKRILDVGCGSGWLSEFFARLGYEVTGIDISPDLVEMSRERLRRLPFQVGPETPLKYQFETHDIESAPLNAFFDAIICYDSLHHFEDEKPLFRHLAAMLDYGGLLFILEGCKPPEGSLTEQELVDVMAEFGTLESPYSNEYMLALLRQNGFVLVGDYVSVDGFFSRDSLQDGRLLEVYPPNVNYLLAKKLANPGEHFLMPDSLQPGQLEANLTPVGKWPERLPPAQTLNATLRIENTGDTLWLPGWPPRRGAVMVGLKIITADGEVVSESHGEPPLRRAMAPGESVTLPLAYPLNLPPGHYQVKIDMLVQHVCWFEQRGSQPLIVPLQIEG